ncbi:hypothetical protein RFI_15022 [Reticulomyxa filosa]|uniref:Uncharacterized protein n=1 Tax=Reticulomyxa filosa TaxID=46433 RepID=X6N8D9_RETFI|nr:hypothetical protein RFI_15022 [Reticulomyxa filosa]|eukprot:ETO22178.1 hypothetical protein RFI_15022 [Reticulomyxa filosa]
MNLERLSSLSPPQPQFVSTSFLSAQPNGTTFPGRSQLCSANNSCVQKPSDGSNLGHALDTRNVFGGAQLPDFGQLITPSGTPGFEKMLQFPLTTPSPSLSMLNSVCMNTINHNNNNNNNNGNTLMSELNMQGGMAGTGIDFGLPDITNTPTPSTLNLFNSIHAALNGQSHLQNSIPMTTYAQTPTMPMFTTAGGASTSCNPLHAASILPSTMNSLIHTSNNLVRSVGNFGLQSSPPPNMLGMPITGTVTTTNKFIVFIKFVYCLNVKNAG